MKRSSATRPQRLTTMQKTCKTLYYDEKNNKCATSTKVRYEFCNIFTDMRSQEGVSETASSIF